MTELTPIAFIAPYRQLRNLALNVRARYSVPVTVLEGDLDEGTRAAREAMQAGARVLISRGGTARRISAALGVSLIEIRISGYDILRSILDFVSSTEAVAVIGFDDIIRSVRPICELLKIPAVFFRIGQKADLPKILRDIEARGLRHVVGDAVSAQAAQAEGLDARLIETGEEAIAEAFDKALAVYANIQEQLRKNQQLETLVSAVDETVILIDSKNNIITSNISGSLRGGLPSARAKDPFDFGEDFLHLISDSACHPESVQEGIVSVSGKEHFASIHRLPMHDQASPGAVIVIRDISKIRSIDRNIRRHQREVRAASHAGFADILYLDPSMDRCVTLARAFARTDSTVILCGETGTGKELFAQAIHGASKWAQGPFVAVNCGAIPPTLVESELFGYVDGAFTGARRGGRIGLFETAHRGTIFLDEINTLDLAMQSRLLRVLQEGEILRVGDSKPVPITVRVVVAANVPLEGEVAEGRFRRDLFYRLNVFTLEIPPLRARRRDVIILFQHFLESFSRAAGRAPPPLEKHVYDWMASYHWPGNVREVQNFAERYFLCATELTGSDNFPDDVLQIHQAPASTSAKSPPAFSAWQGSLREIEYRAVRAVLSEEQGSISRAARRLGIDRNTLRRKAQIQVAK